MNPKKIKPKKKRETKADKTYSSKGSLFTYTSLSKITFASILEEITGNGVCSEFIKEFERIIDEYGLEAFNMTFQNQMCIIEDHPKWIDWLCENDFLSKKLTGEISVGDLFLFNNENCLLTSNGFNDVSLVSTKTGERVTDEVDVSDDNHISNLDKLYEIFELKDDEEDINEKELIKILITRVQKGRFKIVLS